MSTIIVITPHPKNDTQKDAPQTLVKGQYMTNPDAAAVLRAAADELDPPA